MDQLQHSLDQLQQNIIELTGALNAQIEQLKVVDVRLNRLEAGTALVNEPERTPNIPINEAELDSIRRLPDCVRDLQIFEGNPTHYVSWIHNVESILADYAVVSNKPIYRAILKHIRQKIRGPADNALVSYNIFNDTWPNIKKCLSLHYADKRDIQSLENQLNFLRQNRSSIDEFYNKVNHQLSLIINKIKTDDYSEDGMTVLIENYRHRALDVFIRGLQQNLGHLIKIQKPTNLPEAYTACLELQNMDYRKSISNNFPPQQYEFPQYKAAPPTHPPRPNYTQPPQKNFQHKPFIPANIQTPRQYPAQNNAAPPRPTNPKPPIPMEVDPSIQTARINYMNRPGPIVRRSNESSNVPPKYQRMFNLETHDEQVTDHEQYQNDDRAEEEFEAQYDNESAEINFMTGASPELPS